MKRMVAVFSRYRRGIVLVFGLVVASAWGPAGWGAWYDGYDFGSKGVVAYCPFEDGVGDVTGNGHDPANTGVSISSGGRLGSCADVELGDFLEYATLEFGASPATWSFWYRPRQLFVFGSMVLSYQHYAWDGNFIAFGEPDVGPRPFARVGPTPSVTIRSHMDAVEDQWYHVALVVSPEETKLYVNGYLVGADIGKDARVIGGPFLGNTPLNDWWGTQVDGAFDDFVFCDHALSGDEIAALSRDSNGSGVADFFEGLLPPATEITVPDDFASIQEAIDAASDGVEIIVSPGEYPENIAFGGKNIVLRSLDPTIPSLVASTIIYGNNADSVVTFSGVETPDCVLSGFTLTGGNASGGGGINGGNSLATIRNNVISENVASSRGGALYYCDGTIENNTVSGNLASGDGGGLYRCDGIIQYNTISNNSSADDGGGLSECDGTIRNNLVSGNSASDVGGGLCGCDGTIRNNLVVGNSASDAGGGLYDCDGTIENNTVCGNSATLLGGGLRSCDGTIRNCIIWGNSPELQVWGLSVPSYSCIEGWDGSGLGNINSDPLFVDLFPGYYHLWQGSPCIDAGVNGYWFDWPQWDLAGNCRLSGEGIDMGCYEFGAGPDTDGDFLDDNEELLRGTDVDLADSDEDGLRDGLELIRGSDPASVTPPGLLQVPADIRTIQMALAVSMAGDEIEVAPGHYYENLQFYGGDIVLRSTDPAKSSSAESTLIDGSGFGSVVTFQGSESPACALSGFTIMNGNAEHGGGVLGQGSQATIQGNVIYANSAQDGGGLYDCDGSIQDNTITENSVRDDGGGLYDCDGTIQNNTILGNSAEDNGGGLYDCDGTIQDNAILGNSAEDNGGGLYSCDGPIQNNTITENSARDDGGGLSYCHGTIQNNTIAGNSAGENGGGLHGCSGTVEGNTIRRNSAEDHGGGLYDCDGTIQHNTIFGNLAQDNGGGLAGCEGAVRNNIISGNSAQGDGGGLVGCMSILNNIVCANSAYRGGGGSTCYGTIFNNTIYGNFAQDVGGGLADCYGVIWNCIIWGNAASEHAQMHTPPQPYPQPYPYPLPYPFPYPYPPQANLSYCCIQDWTGGGMWNISADPQLVDPTNGDFHLRSTSPCVDAGGYIQDLTEDFEADARPFDASGIPRGDGSDFDIGVDEYVGATDSDGDGIPDADEGLDDPDNDGVPNYLDLDADGDGIPDADEGSGDPDGDGLPNCLDVDSDGDGILDADEGVSDPDEDGLANYLDTDSDGDGILDPYEGMADLDNDGLPNYLDTDCDGDGAPDAEEVASGSDPYDAFDTPSMFGDANRSGRVDAVDVQLVINASLGLDVEYHCDLNGNGYVDAIDVQLAVNAALGS